MHMESKPQENLPDTRPVPVYVLPCADQDDEISLIDLWRVIAARRKLILLSVLAALVLASVYLFLAGPLYRAEAHLLPPQQQDIQELMIYSKNTGAATPDRVYKAFLHNLKSKGLRRKFFDANHLADYYLTGKPHQQTDTDRVFDKTFNDRLKVQVDKQDSSFVTASFVDSDPELVAKRLNQFIAFTNEQTARQLYNNVNAAIQAEIERIRDQLASKLKLAEQRRQDEISRLREALRVASALGIESAGSLSVAADKEKAAIEVNTAKVPLYMRGTKALKAEITVLESRKSDEPFMSGVRDLQERRAFLEGLSINRDKLSTVTIDSTARTPYQAEKPRKKLILVLAGVLGLMAGFFLVFVAEFLSNTREGRKE